MSDTKSSNPKDVLARGEERCLLHLVPTPGLIETAQAMADGARKYGPYNWREEGVGATTYVSAAMRHIRSWLDGEECADDSGVHHLGHAAACLMILLDALAVDNLVDDRPQPAPTAQLLNRIKRGAVKVDAIEAFDSTLQWTGEPQDPESYEPRFPVVSSPPVNAKISGFAEHADPDAGTPCDKIEAAEVYESNPFYEEQAIRVGNEAGQIPQPEYGVGIADELERARLEIKASLEQARVVDPEKYIRDIPERGYKGPPNSGLYKQILRKAVVDLSAEGYHWTYDEGCPCNRCVIESYTRQQKEADSLNSEPTSNPNGGCC